MRKALIGAGILVLACGTAYGQTAEGNLTFDVASVKLSTGAPLGNPGTDGGPGTRYPERYATGIATLRGLLWKAYGLVDSQEQISGPGWIDTEKYAIDARVPAGATIEQFQRMLQNLLAERFKLVIHHETKVLPVYDLVVGKNGPKFKESAAAADATGPPAAGVDRDGFPVLPGGRPGLLSNYALGPSGQVSHWRAQQQPISAFARMLGLPTNAGRVVVDKTGLTGKYDFTLYYDVQVPGAAGVADNPTLTIFDAVEQQLGLKLVDGKAPFDKIVVDRAEKVPSDN
jgi:uncharacterized protein (TIGR03435 family)